MRQLGRPVGITLLLPVVLCKGFPLQALLELAVRVLELHRLFLITNRLDFVSHPSAFTPPLVSLFPLF